MNFVSSVQFVLGLCRYLQRVVAPVLCNCAFTLHSVGTTNDLVYLVT